MSIDFWVCFWCTLFTFQKLRRTFLPAFLFYSLLNFGGTLLLVGIKLIKQSYWSPKVEQLRGAHFWGFAESYRQVALIADVWKVVSPRSKQNCKCQSFFYTIQNLWLQLEPNKNVDNSLIFLAKSKIRYDHVFLWPTGGAMYLGVCA